MTNSVNVGTSGHCDHGRNKIAVIGSVCVDRRLVRSMIKKFRTYEIQNNLQINDKPYWRRERW